MINGCAVELPGGSDPQGKRLGERRDYQSVQSLMIPHVFETAVEGVELTEKIIIASIVLDPELDDSLFVKPPVN